MGQREENPAARPALEALHAASLGAWLGMLIVSGAAAAAAFPTMRTLRPTLPGFGVPADDHWSIAAGHVMNPVFTGVSIGGVVLSLTALAPWVGMSRARRVAAAGALALSVVTLAGVVMPMRVVLGAYWEAARAGQVEPAAAAKAAFDALHPWSSRLLGAEALLAAGMLVLAVRSHARGGAG